jgi:type IV pilus assembly protein PilO
MTNLQDGASQISGVWLKRFWLGLPIAAGGVISFLLLATLILPQWLAIQRDMKRRSELESLRSETMQTRLQIRSLIDVEQKAVAQQTRLFDIVTGNGDLSTFMAMVDREAKQAGVQLDLFEPQAAPPPAPAATPPTPAPAPGKAPPAPAPAPAQAPPGQPAPANAAGVAIKGLRTSSILITAHGPFPALLDFLHRLELLNVLVVQSNLVLTADDKAAATPTASGPKSVKMKMLVTLYGREKPVAPPPAKAAPGASGTVAPPSPQPGASPASSKPGAPNSPISPAKQPVDATKTAQPPPNASPAAASPPPAAGSSAPPPTPPAFSNPSPAPAR